MSFHKRRASAVVFTTPSPAVSVVNEKSNVIIKNCDFVTTSVLLYFEWWEGGGNKIVYTPRLVSTVMPSGVNLLVLTNITLMLVMTPLLLPSVRDLLVPSPFE